MQTKKCPDCGSQGFYIKDPEDQFNIFEFELKEDSLVYSGTSHEPDSPEVLDDTEIFCDRCAWHDKYKKLNS